MRMLAGFRERIGTKKPITCVTQDQHKANVSWGSTASTFETVCTQEAITTVKSIYCPDSCGGHPVCGPCLELSKRAGLLR